MLVAIVGFAASAFAQTGPPKVGGKPLVQIKPKGPTGCKLVGTVNGTKLWAGECETSELRSSAPAAETSRPLSERAIGAIPPGQKQ